MEIRCLKPSEIDVRIGQVGSKGCSLLLYKNARVDMQILDETVGAEFWQREVFECKGNLFCRVGVYSNALNMWVWKSDCGVESNTEKEKGESSDAFKRACVNWGIGRELYTAPFIFVQAETVGDNGRYKLKNPSALYGISVKNIAYNNDREIAHIEIVDKSGNTIFKK